MSLEIVVSSTAGERLDQFPAGLNISHWHHKERLPSGHYAGPPATREAGAFLQYAIQRYDSLPDSTVFLHSDVAVHNPVWLRWLYCLRPGVNFVSLSPVIVAAAPPPEGSPFTHLMNNGSAARYGRRGNPNCCFLTVLSRSAIRKRPLATYQEAYRQLLTGNVNAFQLELQFHLLFRPEVHEWRSTRDACDAFKCEDPACSTQYIRYVKEPGPLSAGHSRKVVPSALLEWEDGSCGVQVRGRRGWAKVRGGQAGFVPIPLVNVCLHACHPPPPCLPPLHVHPRPSLIDDPLACMCLHAGPHPARVEDRPPHSARDTASPVPRDGTRRLQHVPRAAGRVLARAALLLRIHPSRLLARRPALPRKRLVRLVRRALSEDSRAECCMFYPALLARVLRCLREPKLVCRVGMVRDRPRRFCRRGCCCRRRYC